MPTTPTYTEQNLRDLLNSRVHGKLNNLIDPDEILNSSVRFVLNDNYSYTLPVDVKGNKVIDIIPQVKHEYKPDWDLVPEDYFERMKERRENLISLADDDHDRRLLVSRVVNDKSATLGQFEDVNGDGD